MKDIPMSSGLAKDDENPVCHPELVSGSQMLQSQEIPKQVRDDSGDDRKAVFSSEHYPWLALAHIFPNKAALCRSLIGKFSSPERVFTSSFEDLCSVDGITPAMAWEIKSFRHPSPDVEDEIKRIT